VVFELSNDIEDIENNVPQYSAYSNENKKQTKPFYLSLNCDNFKLTNFIVMKNFFPAL